MEKIWRRQPIKTIFIKLVINMIGNKEYKNINKVSERCVGTINIIKILKWGWTIILSKICDINRKIIYEINK